MWREGVKVAGWMRLELVLIENVPGFATKDGGKHLDELLDAMAAHGYSCSHKRLSAADFGVPQNRKRLITAFAMDGAEFGFPEPCPQRLPALPLISVLQPRADVPAICWMPPAKRDWYLDRRETVGKAYVGVIDPAKDTQKISNTLRAGYFKSRFAECLVHYASEDGRVRGLTPIEARHLQSFPDDYVVKKIRPEVSKLHSF